MTAISGIHVGKCLKRDEKLESQKGYGVLE